MLNKEIDKLLRSANQSPCQITMYICNTYWHENNLNGLQSWESTRACYVMGRMSSHLHLWAIPKVFCSVPHERKSSSKSFLKQTQWHRESILPTILKPIVPWKNLMPPNAVRWKAGKARYFELKMQAKLLTYKSLFVSAKFVPLKSSPP